MKSVGKRRPTDHMNPGLNGERIARMWSVVAEQQQQPVRFVQRRSLWGAAAAVALAASVALFFHARASEVAGAVGAGDVITTQRESALLSLADGSSLVLGDSAKLSVLNAAANDVALRLERGRVTCDVTHRPGRSFVVEVRGFAVHVKGTRFTVEAGVEHAGQVAVRVERGVVELRSAGELLATISAGQSWSSSVADAAPAASVGVAGEPAQSAAAPPEADSNSGAATIASDSAPSPSAPLPDAKALFERANAARIAGRGSEAAAAYDQFRRRFASDPRAGLAAFELGRIRLDSLADPQRALSALDFALAHQGGGFAAEDALALRVDALSRLGDKAACGAARQAFSSAYPQSAHAPRVARACAE